MKFILQFKKVIHNILPIKFSQTSFPIVATQILIFYVSFKKPSRYNPQEETSKTDNPHLQCNSKKVYHKIKIISNYRNKYSNPADQTLECMWKGRPGKETMRKRRKEQGVQG